MNKLRQAGLLCASIFLMLPNIANAALVTNGDFETGDLTGWTAAGFYPGYPYVTTSNEFFGYS